MTDVPVVLRLKDAAENTSRFTLVEQIAIDNVPPPAPEELRVVGDEITLDNVSNVVATASATPGREVFLEVEDKGRFPSTVSGNGTVTWNLGDLTDWADGIYTFEAYEAVDGFGNTGRKTSTEVTKDTRLTGDDARILPPRFSPERPFRFDTEVTIEVNLIFEKRPEKPVELEITLSPADDDDETYFLPIEPADLSDLTFLSGILRFRADTVPISIDKYRHWF